MVEKSKDRKACFQYKSDQLLTDNRSDVIGPGGREVAASGRIITPNVVDVDETG